MGVPRTKGKGKTFRWLADHVSYQGDDCLPWPFAKDRRVGRGQLGHDGKHYWAHRLMCKLAHGEPPTPKHQAAHNCGKGHYGCCNPKHLEWKTNSANQLDRAVNGNALRNRNGPRPSLPPDKLAQIHQMRRAGMTQVAIGNRLGVSLGCVQYWLKYRAARGNDQQKSRAFTPAEDRSMLDARQRGAEISEIASLLGRTTGSIQARLRRVA